MGTNSSSTAGTPSIIKNAKAAPPLSPLTRAAPDKITTHWCKNTAFAPSTPLYSRAYMPGYFYAILKFINHVLRIAPQNKAKKPP